MVSDSGCATRLPATLSIGEAWQQVGRQIGRLDARLLIEHVSGCTHADLLAAPESLLGDEARVRLQQLVARRAAGEPLAYLVEAAGFYGLTFRVSPAVLVPRPETERLLELALARAGARPRARVLDLGTGSGALAVSIAHFCPSAEVTAVDLSPAALEVARDNADRLGVEVRFLVGDWYAALGDAGERFDVIVVNPPYVPYGDWHLRQDGVCCEPLLALTDGMTGGDGLHCVRTIVSGAAEHLLPEGWLLLEHGYDQAGRVRRLLDDGGFCGVRSWFDLSGIERVSGGWRP